MKSRRPETEFSRVARVVEAFLLVAFGWLAIAGGAASLPWMATLGELLGFPRGHGPRLLAGSLFAMAAIITLAPSWSKRISLVAAGTLVFAGFASVSSIRATRAAGPDGPGLSGLAALTVAIAAMVAVLAGVLIAIRAYRSASPESRGLSVAWRIVAAFVALGGGLAIAAPPVASRPAAASPATSPLPPVSLETAADAAVESIDLDLASWAGRALSETPLIAHLPGIIEQVGGDPVYLVFFNSSCGTCHELFREHFSAAELPRRVIAIEMPPASDAVLAAGDGLGDIECPGCERLSLPSGPRWLVRPPTVVVVTDGTVVCVDDASDGSCFELSR